MPSNFELLKSKKGELLCSVVIVNCNAKEMLQVCLKSLLEDKDFTSVEIVVVDNGSKDGSIEMVLEEFPFVRLINLGVNLGYTKANNIGIKASKGKYIYLLNNDTEVPTDTIRILLDFLEKNADAGAAASKLVFKDGKLQGSVKNLPNPMSAIFGRHAIITRLFPNNPISKKYLIFLTENFTKPFVVGHASSASLMVSREILDKIGLLDEDYFCYWVDADLCKKILGLGLKVYCVPDAVVTHFEGEGGTRYSFQRKMKSIIDFHKGGYLYYRKHHARGIWSFMALVAIFGLTCRASILIFLSIIKMPKVFGRSVG